MSIDNIIVSMASIIVYALAFLYLKITLLYAKCDCLEGTVQNIIVVNNQSEIDRLMSATHDQSNTPECIHFSLTGGHTYKVNMTKMMILGTNGSLIMESKGGQAKVNCATSSLDLDKTLQPLSNASLVLLDGLVFTGCPVPILLKEASIVVIQNCLFQ